MRLSASIFLCILFLHVSVAQAATPTPAQCAQFQSAAQAKTTTTNQVKLVLSCAGKCTNEEVLIDKGKVTFRDLGGNTAEINPTTRQPTGKCIPNACGTVTITPPGGKKFTISKCDKKFAKANEDLQAGADTGKVVNELAFRDLTKNAINANTPNAQLSGILQSFGVSQADADAAVANDKNKVVDLLQKAADGDTSGAQAAAKELNLNSNLFNDVAKLTPADRVEKFGSVLSDEQKRFITANNLTGFEGPQPLVIDAYGQPQGKVDRGNRIDPTILGNIAADAQRKVCESVTRCFVTKEAQFATLINESPGDVRILGDNNQSASIAQVHRPTAENLANRYRQIYGEDYVLHKINIKDPSLNPEWIANQSMRMQAVVIQSKGEAVGGNYARQLVAYNGSGWKAEAYGVRALNNTYALQNGTAFGYWQTAYNAAGNAAINGPQIQNVVQNVPTNGPANPSPFANVNPFNPAPQNQNRNFIPTSSGVYNVGNTNYQAPAYQQPYNYVYNPQTGRYELQSAQQPSQVQTPTVASLLVQPASIRAGQSAQLSWSSIGVPSGSSCEVIKTQPTPVVVLYRGNEGSVTINTTATSSHAVISFQLRCPSSAGSGYTDRSVSLTVTP